MLWVAVLNVSVRTAQKLSSKHGLSEAEVRMAIVGVKGLRYVWDDSPDGRGLRAIVETNINGRRVLVVLPVRRPVRRHVEPRQRVRGDLMLCRHVG